MRNTLTDELLTVFLEGRVDSTNAKQFEYNLLGLARKYPERGIKLDATELEYISSVGLRSLLKLRKSRNEAFPVVNVSDEVYGIFEVTGFTDLFEVTKKPKEIDIEDAELLMHSVNGTFYKKTDDTMIKLYKKGVTLEQVQKERELARKALVIGVPTVIPFDVGMVDGRYGIVYEAIEAKTLSNILAEAPKHTAYYADKFANFLYEVHEVKDEFGDFPNIKDKYEGWLEEANGIMDDKERLGLLALVKGLPDDDSYVHGNINPGNVVVHHGEFVLIDMAASAHGHSLFDLQGVYASFAANFVDGQCNVDYGLSEAQSKNFWELFYPKYMKTTDPKTLLSMKELLKKYYIINQKLMSVLENAE